MGVYYLETGSTDPAYNLAFEEYVQANRREGNYLILWQNANAVIIGRNQNAEAEINRQFVDQHGIRVVRRNTGGGAVYHDMGNLNYSFITDAAAPQDRSAAQFTSPVVNALMDLGLDAAASGRNDILISGHKISGTAQYLMKDRLLHHGTLLFDSDLSTVSEALNPDPTKLQSKGIKSVRSRVGNIRQFLTEDMNLGEFWNYLKESLADELIPTTLSDEEKAAVAALKQEKYDTWQWNYGKSPAYQQVSRKRFSGGLLELHVTVDKGIIQALGIYGDFLALTPVEPLEAALLGCPRRADAIEAVLAQQDLSCLGSITPQEFIEVLLQ